LIRSRHPANGVGWPIGWSDQVLTKVITVAAEGQVTDAQVAAAGPQASRT
jgi:hypothetical protein